MILQPSNVELKKIHYYEKNIPTISQEIDKNRVNRNAIIKKNIFGHKWVLKINEDIASDRTETQKKNTLKFVLYFWVFLSIIIAFGFGLLFTLNITIFKQREKYIPNIMHPKDSGIRNRPSLNTIESNTISYEINNQTTIATATTEKKPFCLDCVPNEICMKINDTTKPECWTPIDQQDPTGCGGLCLINTEYCKLLSNKYQVYQCLPIKQGLICNDNEFNCKNRCINLDKRCDGIMDCSNQLDELNCDCNLLYNFHCGNKTSCLDLSLRCNGIKDCWDNSDEENCFINVNNNCDYKCDDGYCILKEQVCDGVHHCADQSDEWIGCSPIITNL